MATTITKHTAVTAQPTVAPQTPQVAPQGYNITKHTAVTAQPTVTPQTPQVAPQGYDLKKARSRADSESSACLKDSAEKSPGDDMAKQPTKQHLHSWAVYHIKCTPA